MFCRPKASGQDHLQVGQNMPCNSPSMRVYMRYMYIYTYLFIHLFTHVYIYIYTYIYICIYVDRYYHFSQGNIIHWQLLCEYLKQVWLEPSVGTIVPGLAFLAKLIFKASPGTSPTVSNQDAVITSNVETITNTDWDFVETNNDMICVWVKIQNQDPLSNPKYPSLVIMTLYLSTNHSFWEP